MQTFADCELLQARPYVGRTCLLSSALAGCFIAPRTQAQHFMGPMHSVRVINVRTLTPIDTQLRIASGIGSYGVNTQTATHSGLARQGSVLAAGSRDFLTGFRASLRARVWASRSAISRALMPSLTLHSRATAAGGSLTCSSPMLPIRVLPRSPGCACSAVRLPAVLSLSGLRAHPGNTRKPVRKRPAAKPRGSHGKRFAWRCHPVVSMQADSPSQDCCGHDRPCARSPAAQALQ
jgi:hypothetical protein